MTVLEKIKRCVSLVWDFQEIYGEEDIEEFCRNELRTYPQHDEIMKYFKHIEDLEKENAELKAELSENKVADCHIVNGLCEQLTEAKEIIREFMKYEINEYDGSLEIHFEELKKQAEQFLKDCEVEK
jgi:predicted RNase H-like nuclease (RuvC/YqgF family)